MSFLLGLLIAVPQLAVVLVLVKMPYLEQVIEVPGGGGG